MTANCGTLEGRSVVVTGASRGIGLATARVVADAGARVFCLARASNRLDDAVASLGYGAVAVPCDLANADEIDRAFDAIVTACGGFAGSCNALKGGRDPDNSGFFPLKQPVRPKWLPAAQPRIDRASAPVEWLAYLPA